MYSALDVQQARWIRSLIDDLGMNLAGVDVVIRMSAQMENLEQEVHRLRSELAGLP
jgi:MerR family transcriptional regulator/heat shock protein HspR